MVSRRVVLVGLYYGYVSLVTSQMLSMTMLWLLKTFTVAVAKEPIDKQDKMFKMRMPMIHNWWDSWKTSERQMMTVGTWLDMLTMEHTAMPTRTQQYSPGY